MSTTLPERVSPGVSTPECGSPGVSTPDRVLAGEPTASDVHRLPDEFSNTAGCGRVGDPLRGLRWFRPGTNEWPEQDE
ncbi:hypothetical protein G9C85_10800 [Halorubellus sp. JP-L1]|uniref:hypothetical protein n=1 Tax=Halorubellus sp. JP-L1 TaxID=2715753 RepID=UPI00140BFA8B|nr:hypothetical protein [Halorubellus sp. JP-L1]NHN42113.1 hypothetical protein [Halorubellus sp. JP-L1]